MGVTIVLAVGLDPWLLATHSEAWRAAGYFFASAGSIGEAIDLFNDGDFDEVVLGPSISSDNRKRLTSLIRASGSQTPVAFIGNLSGDSDLLADSRLKSDSSPLHTGLRELLAEKANRTHGVSSAATPDFRRL